MHNARPAPPPRASRFRGARATGRRAAPRRAPCRCGRAPAPGGWCRAGEVDHAHHCWRALWLRAEVRISRTLREEIPPARHRSVCRFSRSRPGRRREAVRRRAPAGRAKRWRAVSTPRSARGWLSPFARGAHRIVHSSIDVKSWACSPPKCEAARPACCRACGAAGREPGRPLTIVGHGLRARGIEGPHEPGEAAKDTEVLCRRYACNARGAILVVVPSGVGRAFRYSLSAVAYALMRRPPQRPRSKRPRSSG